MTRTAYGRFSATTTELQAPDPARVVTTGDWVVVAAWVVTPPNSQTNWHVAASVDCDVDPGVTAALRLRIAGGGTSAQARTDANLRRLQLGWTPVPGAATRVFLEVRREFGLGGVRVRRATTMAMSAPPPSLIPGPTYPPGYLPPASGPYPDQYTDDWPYGTGAGTGRWAVVDGRILTPDGIEFHSAGFNGGVGIGTGAAFTIAPSTFIAWAYDRFPGNFKLYVDTWPGDANTLNGAEVFPGGTVSPGSYWNSAPIDATGGDPLVGGPTIVTLPDRVYALTGVRSAAAISHGITAPADHWHAKIFRVNCHLRNGPNTWSGAPTKTAAQLAVEYVARVRELVDLGLVVSPVPQDSTAQIGVPDYSVPPALLADPMLDPSLLPDGAVRDSIIFYDALVAEFDASDAVWIAGPNEFCQTGRTTAYDDVIVTLARRLWGKGWRGITTFALPRWAGDLAALARGDLDTLADRLAPYQLGPIVWEWHNYGDRYDAAGTQSVGTWAQVDADIAACRNGVPGSGRKYAVWMAEYGQPLPPGTGLPHAPDGVRLTATNIDGPALGIKWPHLCPTWWSTADNSFDVSYPVTYGAANKGNEAGPDPNSTGANPGTYPWWDVTTAALRDEWLTVGGRAHWDLAHAIWQET